MHLLSILKLQSQLSICCKNKIDREEDKTTYEFILKNLHNIFYQFYYYMDFLALEMIPMQDFKNKIYNRFNDDESFNSLFELEKLLNLERN